MKKLEAKTKEQQDYITALVEEESCDGEVKVCEGGIDYTVDQCFGVGISFDTMAEIVDYLRNEPVSEDLDEVAKADAMIEKAEEWLKLFLNNSVCIKDVGERAKRVIVDDFRKAMKG